MALTAAARRRLAGAHPCFTCPLPDCDEASAACPLRQAHRRYNRAIHRSEDAGPFREGQRHWYNEYQLDRDLARRGLPPRDVVRVAGEAGR